MPYEDGARTLFLYIKGQEGNPPEELRELTRYMAESTEANARTKGLRRLHEMVTKVKADREVGLAYMKVPLRQDALPLFLGDSASLFQ